jgi:hypothetical protein
MDKVKISELFIPEETYSISPMYGCDHFSSEAEHRFDSIYSWMVCQHLCKKPVCPVRIRKLEKEIAFDRHPAHT